MANLLVTGGAGFIGANFVHHWIETRPADDVTVLDALTYAGNRANLAALDGRTNFQFVHGDIRDFDLVQQLLLSGGYRRSYISRRNRTWTDRFMGPSICRYQRGWNAHVAHGGAQCGHRSRRWFDALSPRLD